MQVCFYMFLLQIYIYTNFWKNTVSQQGTSPCFSWYFIYQSQFEKIHQGHCYSEVSRFRPSNDPQITVRKRCITRSPEVQVKEFWSNIWDLHVRVPIIRACQPQLLSRHGDQLTYQLVSSAALWWLLQALQCWEISKKHLKLLPASNTGTYFRGTCSWAVAGRASTEPEFPVQGPYFFLPHFWYDKQKQTHIKK